jgi:hypothetical protein
VEGIVDGLNQEATPLVIEATSFFELELKPVVLRGTLFVGQDRLIQTILIEFWVDAGNGIRDELFDLKSFTPCILEFIVLLWGQNRGEGSE